MNERGVQASVDRPAEMSPGSTFVAVIDHDYYGQPPSGVLPCSRRAQSFTF